MLFIIVGTIKNDVCYGGSIVKKAPTVLCWCEQVVIARFQTILLCGKILTFPRIFITSVIGITY